MQERKKLRTQRQVLALLQIMSEEAPCAFNETSRPSIMRDQYTAYLQAAREGEGQAGAHTAGLIGASQAKSQAQHVLQELGC